jgi:hypothetical protein
VRDQETMEIARSDASADASAHASAEGSVSEPASPVAALGAPIPARLRPHAPPGPVRLTRKTIDKDGPTPEIEPTTPEPSYD